MEPPEGFTIIILILCFFIQQVTEIQLRIHIALIRCLQKPRLGNITVFGNAQALFIALTDGILGFYMALHRCHFVILRSLGKIFRDTLAVFKGTGDIMLAVYIPTISSKLEPASSLCVILPHTLSVLAAHTHMVLGQCIAFFRSLAVPFHRFDRIRLHTSAQLAGIAKGDTSLFMA